LCVMGNEGARQCLQQLRNVVKDVEHGGVWKQNNCFGSKQLIDWLLIVLPLILCCASSHRPSPTPRELQILAATAGMVSRRDRRISCHHGRKRMCLQSRCSSTDSIGRRTGDGRGRSLRYRIVSSLCMYQKDFTIIIIMNGSTRLTLRTLTTRISQFCQIWQSRVFHPSSFSFPEFKSSESFRLFLLTLTSRLYSPAVIPLGSANV
jgi:hypothetical protein